jgi:hypothetical protein
VLVAEDLDRVLAEIGSAASAGAAVGRDVGIALGATGGWSLSALSLAAVASARDLERVSGPGGRNAGTALLVPKGAAALDAAVGAAADADTCTLDDRHVTAPDAAGSRAGGGTGSSASAAPR